VDHVQWFETRLGVSVERLPREQHVRERGLSALGFGREHFHPVHDRGERGREAVGAVGVPARVVALENNALVVLGEMLAVGRDVRDVVELDLVLALVFLRECFELAELLRERDLRVGTEFLLAETQHVVVEECLIEPRERGRREGLRDVESDDLCAEGVAEAIDLERDDRFCG